MFTFRNVGAASQLPHPDRAGGLSVCSFQVLKLPHQGTAGAEFLGYQQKENQQDRIREFTNVGHERITTCARIGKQLPPVNPGYFAYFRTVGTR
jgi:hypothetical protein